MEIFIKEFSDLTTHELYEILALRSEVFVVEQECAYQDVDGKDMLAYHFLCYEKTRLIAYLRIFLPSETNENANIGRVLVKKPYRKSGLGEKIMSQAIDFILVQDNSVSIELSAQSYLTKFYKNLGFITEGSEYLEDGIPHIKMVRWAKS